MEKFTIEDFKANYESGNKQAREELIQSALLYPERFDRDVAEYVSYLWDRLYEVYTIDEVPFEDVFNDERYKTKSWEDVSLASPGIAFKLRMNGDEIGQGLYDYISSKRIVSIRYLEFLNPPLHPIVRIMKQIFMNKYAEDVYMRFAI